MISASIISPILRVTTPILLCALGGVYSERSDGKHHLRGKYADGDLHGRCG